MGPCADEPERDSGFAVYAAGQRANNWRYQLAEVAGGTAVTESFELGGHPALKLYGLVLEPLWRHTNIRGTQQTLERVRDVVEADG